MLWLFSIRKFIYPKEKYIWAQVRILHETEKAILINNGMKIWITKLQIYGIRLRNNIFEIYVKESTVGWYLGLYSGCSTPTVTVLTSNRSYAQRFEHIRRFAIAKCPEGQGVAKRIFCVVRRYGIFIFV